MFVQKAGKGNACFITNLVLESVGQRMARKKVVLAYSGGLDTSVAVKWLADTYDADVYTMTVDLGQGDLHLKEVEAKAKKVGATEAFTVDAKEEFVQRFVFPALQANALYENKYPLATAIGRPLIAEKLVEVANKVGADAISHGCTAKGNDQVRFEVTTQALAPHLETIAPAREWRYTREEAIEYANQHGIPVPVKKKSPYSIDENLWGRSVEGGPVENVTEPVPEDAYAWTRSVLDAPSTPEVVAITFAKGIPVALNGKKTDGVDLVVTLNGIAGKHGVGRIDTVEDRLVGIKSREIYEAPAAVTLIRAHQELESLVLTKDVLHFKPTLEAKFSELAYNGLWASPLMSALQAFVVETQQYVTGTVKLRLFKGTVAVVSRESEFSLYRHDLSTYGKGDTFDHTAAKGFITIWGLPLKVVARVRGKKPIKSPSITTGKNGQANQAVARAV